MKTTIKPGIRLPRIIAYPDITYSIRNYKSLSHIISNKAYVLRPFFGNDRIKEELHPLIIYAVGGGFTVCPPLAQMSTLYALAEHGYVVASISYPTSNIAPFPSQIEEVKSAIRFFRKNAAKFGIDAGKIAIMGESAGASLAVLAGLTGDSGLFETDDNQNVSDSVKAVIDLYGPTDMKGLEKVDNCRFKASGMLLFNNDKETEKSFDSLQYVSSKAPSFLILHGTEDKIVDCSYSEKLYKKLKENNVEADLVLLEGAGHADIMFCQQEINDLITDFLDKKFQK